MKRYLPALAACMMLSALILPGCQWPRTETTSTIVGDDPAWASGARDPSPRTLYALAKILLDQGRDDQAKELLVRIITEDPAFSPAYIDLAEIHMRQRNCDQAITTLSAGLAACPKDAMLINNIGTCYIVKGNNAKALASFQDACGADPQNTRYRTNMAMALGMLGRYDESLAIYEQVLQPQDAHYNLAVLCEARKDFDRAAMEFELAKMSFGPTSRPSTAPATKPR